MPACCRSTTAAEGSQIKLRRTLMVTKWDVMFNRFLAPTNDLKQRQK